MSLLTFTGFYGISTAEIARRFGFVDEGVGTITIEPTSGRFGGPALRIYTPTVASTADAAFCAHYLAAPLTTIIIGISVCPISTAPVDPGRVNMLQISSEFDALGVASNLFEFKINTVTNALQALVRPSESGYATRIYEMAPGTMSLSTWTFLEVALTIDPTNGGFAVRKDGVVVLAASGLDTQGLAPTNAARYFGFGGWQGEVLVDAFYVSDTGGTAPHSSFIGPVRVEPAFPSADSTPVDFTPLSSTNESNIDDANAPDGDATYNHSATVGARDQFTVAGFTSPSRYVYGYAVRAQARATVEDGRALAALLDDGAAVTAGEELLLADDYDSNGEAVVVVAADPLTHASAAAASTFVNSLEIGYELTH